MHQQLLRYVSQVLANLSSLLRSCAGAFFAALAPRRSGRLVFLGATEFQRFRRHVAPPARFIYAHADEGAVIVAAVTGGGRVVVSEDVSRGTLFRIYEQVCRGVDVTAEVVLVDELDTTINDHYGGYATQHILDTTVDDHPPGILDSPVSEIILSNAPIPAKVLPFRRG